MRVGGRGRRRRGRLRRSWWSEWKGSRIRDDASRLLNKREFKRDLKGSFKLLYVLSRATGGANGLGEQTRSFTKDEAYTPRARL
jgi:hypothetical protein